MTMDPSPRRIAGALAFGALYLLVISLPAGSDTNGWWLGISGILGVWIGYNLWPRVEIAMREGVVWKRAAGSAVVGACAVAIFVLVFRLIGEGASALAITVIFLFFIFFAYISAPGINRELRQQARSQFEG